ncbi:hypothetical protein VSU01S_34780 [Vibrio superstes NBRC 103154]|uniref:Sucrose-6-phosphate hydrolase n=2 Tax=Vibrio superstes TaxID=198815 RepID=A0A511QV36_9VIBR|nr:hypothetical protein VSU01S_34780 [Vibrio superstes NBRC 103154]
MLATAEWYVLPNLIDKLSDLLEQCLTISQQVAYIEWCARENVRKSLMSVDLSTKETLETQLNHYFDSAIYESSTVNHYFFHQFNETWLVRDKQHQHKMSDVYAVAFWTLLIQAITKTYWYPKRIWVCSNAEAYFRQLFPAANYQLFVERDKTGVELPEGLLNQVVSTKTLAISTPQSIDNWFDLQGTLQLSLKPYLINGRPSIETAASILGMHPRQLQRRLQREQLKYSKVVDELIFESAKKDLVQSQDDIADIAFRYGYRLQTHFSRAFKKYTNLTPTQYREHRSSERKWGDWTRKQRYQRIRDMPEGYFNRLAKERQQDKGYPSFHIAPPFGLLNDPNGLSYFNGEHHIFYQWFPLGPVHGVKHWYHLSTADFIHFSDHGVALYPDQDYDSHGVYSGSGLVNKGELLLFFTGNKRNGDWVREPTQCYAVMDVEGKIAKKGVVVRNSFYTEHFRDPKVWKEGETYYMVVAAQTHEKHGAMALFRADELDNWHHLGPVKTRYSKFGFMWECPDYFELQGRGVMLFSPQGVNGDNEYDYKNIFSVSYLVGDRLNLDTLELQNHQPVVQPDYGFDFYAPQTYLDDQGRRIMLAWIGLPDIDPPSVRHQWAGLLSIPRELNLQGNMLIQSPLKELQDLRQDSYQVSQTVVLDTTTFELEFSTKQDFTLEMSNSKGHDIRFSLHDNKFTLDRSNNSILYAEDYGVIRNAPRLDRQQNIRLFVDNSVLEIFINNGKHTMTSRFFVDDMNSLTLSEGVAATLYPLAGINGLNTAKIQ